MPTVIISGGSSGIGFATVQRFLNAGYVVINLDIEPLAFNHEKLVTLLCDVASVEAIENAMVHISTLATSIDVLVCSAGVHFSANLLQSTEADFDRLVNINIKSCFFLSQAVLPWMIKAKKGAIVYVGSDQTLIAKRNSSLYGMTKAALAGLTKSTALDFASDGIRANLVAAGTVDTPLVERVMQQYSVRENLSLAEVVQAEAAQFPVGRIAQAKEIADFIYFLSSDQALFITGAIMPIEGGYTAQ